MAWVVDEIQEEIIDFLRTELDQFEIDEGARPNAETVKVDTSGTITNYITFQLSDVRLRRSGSFAGVRHDEYYFTLDVQVVSGNAQVSRKARNKINDVLLGFKPKYSGQVGKEYGISNYTFTDPKVKGQVYVSPASFQVSVTAEVG